MNDLLNKYWEGTLNLKEEDKLRKYFASSNVAPEHEIYRDLFETFSEEACIESSVEFNAFGKIDEFKEASEDPKSSMWKGLAIAAGFSLLIAVGFISKISSIASKS